MSSLASRGLGKETATVLAAESQRGTQAMAQDLLAALKLKPSPQNVLAVRALMSEGLPLTLTLMQILARVQRKFPGEEAAAGRIAARALIAGIDPESADMDELWSQLLVPGSSHQADTGSSGHDTDSRRKNSPPGGDSAKEGELASKLADLSIQAFKNPGMLNFCRPGPLHKAWVHVPFSFPLDKVEFSGIFRILYNYSTGISECLAADIKTGGTRRLLCVSGRDASICLRFGSDKPEESAAIKASFAREGLEVLVYQSPGQLDDDLMDMAVELASYA